VRTIAVQVRDDHLALLSRAKPMAAMAELIWNALDAEATEVRIVFCENTLGGLETIRIVDNGHGLAYAEAAAAFESLGGSWKRQGPRTTTRKRMLHGRYGKGRFRAFALGNRVEWCTVGGYDGDRRAYRIRGHAGKPGEFELTEPASPNGSPNGMVVEIADLPAKIGLLRGVKAVQEVTELFAPYLRQYPDVRIVYDGVPLDPTNAEDRIVEYDLGELVTENGERVRANLSVVEWNVPGKRGLLLCDENGFALYPAGTRLLFRGFSYTAYLKSAHLSALETEGLLEIDELAPDVRQLVDTAKVVLRDHFHRRAAERAQTVIEEWRALGLYPYDGAPADDAEEAERRVFDTYAVLLGDAKDFALASPALKRFALGMLRELLHLDPARAPRVIDDFLSRPKERLVDVDTLLGNMVNVR